MKRKLIVAALALLMVIVGIAVFLYNSIDSIVEAAIEREGSRVLGTQVSVGSVDISLKSGRGTIHGVSVSNPKGFSSKEMFTLGEITVDIDVKSLNRDPVVIDEITISAPKVRAEMNAQAQANVGVVKRAVDQYQSAPAPKGHKEDSGFEKRFVIEKLVFEKGIVDVDATAMGVEATQLELLPVRLNRVGGSKGDSPDGIAKTVSRAFLDAVTDVVADEAKRRATDKAKEKLNDETKKLIHNLIK
jgi:uncharacterized protein involved in outer membrane biogenesis